MRALVLSMVVPVPPDRGDRLRAWDVIESLRAQGEVDLVLLTNDPIRPDGEELLSSRGINVRRIAPRLLEKLSATLVASLSGRPWGAWRISRLREAVQEIGTWDIVVALQMKSAYYGVKAEAPRHVLDLTDSLGLYRRALGPRRSLVRWISLTGASREEALWARRYDVVVLSATADAEEVRRRAPYADVRVVENGTRPWAEPVPPGGKESLLFVGDLRYLPNRDGLNYLLREIWPEVYCAHPRFQLRIVGEPPRKCAAAEGVCWVGYVPDLAPEYRRALALLNTVRFGTGSRRKVLDAWAAGVPVISTEAGAVGLRYESGEDILVAQDGNSFANAVSMLENEEMWQRISRFGWERAQTYAAHKLWRRFWADRNLSSPVRHFSGSR